MMIDAHIQEELRNRYNPEGSKLREMQLNALEILKTIDNICRRNNINYWLGSGTLLGAVRHGGFIPWDDDIDIEIDRKDRKRFIAVCKTELPSHFHIQNHDTESNYYLNILKVRDDTTDIGEKINLGKYGLYDTNYKYKGCFVDIFCVEPCIPFFLKLSNFFLNHLLSLRFVRKKGGKLCDFLWALMELCNSIFRIIGIICADQNTLYPGYSSCFGENFGYNCKHIYPIRTMMFEDIEVKVPSNPDGYLKEMYGNYMEIPSDFLRESHHSNI